MVQFHHGAYRYARFYLIPRHSGNKGESQELLFMHHDKLRFNGELSFFLNPPPSASPQLLQSFQMGQPPLLYPCLREGLIYI